MAHPRQGSLQDSRFNRRALQDAIKGVRIPDQLGSELAHRCVVAGIRRNADFGHELLGLTPRITRALNAQAIMYNRCIPKMSAPEQIPYCIWYPAFPSRDTCRKLIALYPEMEYHVGRVCAVANYEDVYEELDILPEVAIAEEARESGSEAICSAILSQRVKYAVFDDYSRALNLNDPPISHLNGDTCITKFLHEKQSFTKPNAKSIYQVERNGFEDRMYDITEDMSIDLETTELQPMDQPAVVPLLYSPLPADLPTVEKDLLILSAAYHGNIDRYMRLRRPYEINGEVACLIRGIYHDPLFAKFWSLKPATVVDYDLLQPAITARYIMSNDLSRITKDTPVAELPYCIWFPQPAYHTVYETLARVRPDMMLQAARACIVANYQKSYQQIDPPHDAALLKEAQASPNPFFLEHLRAKQARGDSTGETYDYEYWKFYTIKDAIKPSSATIRAQIDARDVRTTQDWVYDGVQADMSWVEVSICAPDRVKKEGVRDVMLRYPPAS